PDRSSRGARRSRTTSPSTSGSLTERCMALPGSDTQSLQAMHYRQRVSKLEHERQSLVSLSAASRLPTEGAARTLSDVGFAIQAPPLAFVTKPAPRLPAGTGRALRRPHGALHREPRNDNLLDRPCARGRAESGAVALRPALCTGPGGSGR